MSFWMAALSDATGDESPGERNGEVAAESRVDLIPPLPSSERERRGQPGEGAVETTDREAEQAGVGEDQPTGAVFRVVGRRAEDALEFPLFRRFSILAWITGRAQHALERRSGHRANWSILDDQLSILPVD
ncbi:MAG: hypothetical protein R3A46_15120 [Thermomicrobiales bacterium]